MSEHNSRLMSIGEVAKSLHITRRMILNYEDKGILLPDVKTGSGGNRYYTPETLTRIRAIRRLQTLGISLDEIKLYFEDAADLRDIIARLEKLRDELNLCIEKLQLRVRENSNEAPIIRTIPPQTVYVYRCPSPTVEDRKEIFRDVIPAAMRQYGTDSAKRMYFIDYPSTIPTTSTSVWRCRMAARVPMCRTGRRRRPCASSSTGTMTRSRRFGSGWWPTPGSRA